MVRVGVGERCSFIDLLISVSLFLSNCCKECLWGDVMVKGIRDICS